MNFLIWLLVFMLFFSYLLNNIFISFIIILLILYELIFQRTKIKFYKDDFLIIACVIFMLVSILICGLFDGTLTYFLLFLSGTILLLLLRNHSDWFASFIKSIITFSSIHIFATFSQYCFPSAFNTVLLPRILSDRQYLANMYMLGTGGYAGITGQTGANAFYIALFIIITYNFILSGKFKKKNYFWVFVAFIALVLTGKIGPIVSVVVSIIYTTYLFIFKKMKKNNNFVFIKNAVVCLFILLIIYIVTSIDNLYSLLDSLSSGRFGIYESVIKMIHLHPFLGNGLLSVPSIIGIYAHNIYLQLFAELGFLGFIIFAIFFISVLFNSKKCFLNCNDNIKSGICLTCVGFISYFLFYGLTGNPIYDGFTLMFFMLFLSIILFMKYGGLLNEKK